MGFDIGCGDASIKLATYSGLQDIKFSLVQTTIHIYKIIYQIYNQIGGSFVEDLIKSDCLDSYMKV